jgi:hypothetical protein
VVRPSRLHAQAGRLHHNVEERLGCLQPGQHGLDQVERAQGPSADKSLAGGKIGGGAGNSASLSRSDCKAPSALAAASATRN